MSFFRWLPDDSPRMVSPYISVYFGLTVVITALTVLFWRWNNKKHDDPLLEKVVNGVIDLDDVERGSSGFISIKNSLNSDGSGRTDDVEMQAMRRN